MTKQEETIRLLNNFANDYLTNKHDQELFEHAIECVSKQKVGKWIDHSEEGYVECPRCGHLTTCNGNIADLHYCFWCGAKMGGDEYGNSQ